MRATHSDGRSRPWRVRRRLFLVFCLLAAMVAAWLTRARVLTGVGNLLVKEDPLTSTAIIVVSIAAPGATALEGAMLYQHGVAPVVVVPTGALNPLLPRINALGIAQLGTTELMTAILQRSGVPAGALTILPEPVDGTEMETHVIARFVRQHRPSSVMLVTARTHTARARWLLRRSLPAEVRVIVRSSRFDEFAPGGWWHRRDQSREVVVEYLRWVKSLVLPRLWIRSPSAATALSSRPKPLPSPFASRAGAIQHTSHAAALTGP